MYLVNGEEFEGPVFPASEKVVAEVAKGVARFECVASRVGGVANVVESNLLAAAGVRVIPCADAFPMIGRDGWAGFVEDVRRNGVRSPIAWSADGERLVDGRNRLSAWLELGNDVASCPSVNLAEGDDEIDFVVSANLARREMSKAERAFAAAKALPAFAARSVERRAAGLRVGACSPLASKEANGESGKAADVVGRAFGVSRPSVERAASLLRAAEGPDPVVALAAKSLIARVESGAKSLLDAAAELREGKRVAAKAPEKSDAEEAASDGAKIADWLGSVSDEVLAFWWPRYVAVVDRRDGGVFGEVVPAPKN